MAEETASAKKRSAEDILESGDIGALYQKAKKSKEVKKMQKELSEEKKKLKIAEGLKTFQSGHDFELWMKTDPQDEARITWDKNVKEIDAFVVEQKKKIAEKERAIDIFPIWATVVDLKNFHDIGKNPDEDDEDGTGTV